MKYKFTYPILHYLLTLILSPFIVMFMSDNPYLNNIASPFIMMLMGLLYSLPTFIIYIIEFIVLRRYQVNQFVVKTALIFTALIGMVITILILFDQDELVLMVAYGIVINILGLVLPMSKKIETEKK